MSECLTSIPELQEVLQFFQLGKNDPDRTWNCRKQWSSLKANLKILAWEENLRIDMSSVSITETISIINTFCAHVCAHTQISSTVGLSSKFFQKFKEWIRLILYKPFQEIHTKEWILPNLLWGANIDTRIWQGY